jgi:hypothetical protein
MVPSWWRALVGVVGLASILLCLALGISVMVFDAWPRFEFLPMEIANHLIRFTPVLTVLFCLVSWLLYVVDASTNPLVPSEKRGLWITVILFGGLAVMPFYFWWYMRPNFGRWG